MRVFFHHEYLRNTVEPILYKNVSYSFDRVDNVFSEFFADHGDMCFEGDAFESKVSFTYSPHGLKYICFVFWISLVAPKVFENAIFLI